MILQQLVFSPRKGAVKELMRGSGLIDAVMRLIEDGQLDGELNPAIEPRSNPQNRYRAVFIHHP